MGSPRSFINRGSRARCLLLVLLTGCATNWQAQQAAPQQVVESTGETEVRVTLKSGTNAVIRDPGVEGDSLVGWQQQPGDPPEVALVRQAFALNDIRTVSVRKGNTGANIAIGLGIGAALFLVSVTVAIAIVCGGGGCD